MNRGIRHPSGGILGLLVAFGMLVGCRGETAPDGVPVEVEVGVAPTPPMVGPARIVVMVRDSVGGPVEGASVRIEATMDHPGMGPVLEPATDQGEGHYLVPALELDMAGDWILTVRVRLPDGREAIREHPVRAVSPPRTAPRS